ncbi:MAG: TIGR03435 family protein [Acidobacteria bacterium]|nr:TIGR03435 family protein [Acidobacteriota bacterium]
MKRLLYEPLIALLLICAAAYCQNVSQPSFEVVSLKKGGNIFATRPVFSGGRLRWTTQLIYLVGYAYNLDFTLVKGAGANLAIVYSVEATFDPAATEEQVRLMVQSLLVDRFKMRAHRVITETEGYALSIGKGGLKIKDAKPIDEHPLMLERFGIDKTAARAESFIAATIPEAGVTAITGQRASVPKLAQTLQRVTGTPVWDRTGLRGEYNFEFRFAQGLSATVESAVPYPQLATALKENLGLEMNKQKGPLESLIVDYIEEPSEN